MSSPPRSSRPGSRAGHVRAAALVERLRRGLRRRLTLLEAPAGSGKSTLLAEWRAGRASGVPFAWLVARRGRQRSRSLLDVRHRVARAGGPRRSRRTSTPRSRAPGDAARSRPSSPQLVERAGGTRDRRRARARRLPPDPRPRDPRGARLPARARPPGAARGDRLAHGATVGVARLRARGELGEVPARRPALRPARRGQRC